MQRHIDKIVDKGHPPREGHGDTFGYVIGRRTRQDKSDQRPKVISLYGTPSNHTLLETRPRVESYCRQERPTIMCHLKNGYLIFLYCGALCTVHDLLDDLVVITLQQGPSFRGGQSV